MIVLIGRPQGYHCLECGGALVGDYISMPTPWGALVLHPKCAQHLGAELIEEAGLYFDNVKATPVNTGAKISK